MLINTAIITECPEPLNVLTPCIPDFSHPRLVIRGPDAGIDFLVDGLELEEVPADPEWRLKANQYIEIHRKSNINFK